MEFGERERARERENDPVGIVGAITLILKVKPKPAGWSGNSKKHILLEPAAADGFVDLRINLWKLGWGRQWNQIWLSVGKLEPRATASYHLHDVALCLEC
jgi:hypothetical protein